MSIDWDDNARAAVNYFADWLIADYGYIANLEDFYKRLPQTKTVADAYEYVSSWKSVAFDFLFWYEPVGFVYRPSLDAPKEYRLVCTREQFEAYAKEQEQEGEKWTHTWKGDKCRIVFTEGESSWINGHFLNTIVHNSSLKPIKPKLTAKEYDLVADVASHFNIDPAHFNDYMGKFDCTLIHTRKE